ncbi:MAG: TrpR-like protein, YerC/YecD, partial [Ruminococcus sp.]|nr:TrpR-like protein, YerC/YecD [Ruminococcus sp.]
LLTENHVYSDIVKETGASTATISRVNRSLAYDAAGGYAIVFDRLKEQKKGEDK